MRNLWVGAKAGAVTGLVTGAFPIVSLSILHVLIWPGGAFITPEPLIAWGILLLGLLVVAAFSLLLFTGVLCLVGVLYVVVERWVPGISVGQKSVLLFLILWILIYGLIVPWYVPTFLDFRIASLTVLWDLIFAIVFAHFLRKYEKPARSIFG